MVLVQNKTQIDLIHKIQGKIFSFCPIQKTNQSNVKKNFKKLNYVLTYFVVYVAIAQALTFSVISEDKMLSLAQQLDNITFWLKLACLGFSLFYIIFQNQTFIIGNKLCEIVSLILITNNSNQNSEIHVFTFCLQLVQSLVWAIKIQNRMKHFDSRLHSFYPFIKQWTTYVFLFIVRFIIQNSQNRLQIISQNFGWSFYQLQLCLLILLVIILFGILDYKDFIYNQHFKDMLLFADFCLLTLLGGSVYSQVYKNDMSSSTILGLSLMFFFFILLFSKLTISKKSVHIYKKNIHSLNKQAQDTILEYFQQLRRMLDVNDSKYKNQQSFNQQLTRYIYFHLENCHDKKCQIQKLVNHKGFQLSTTKCGIIKDFILRQLQPYSKEKQKLIKYMFYLIEPHTIQANELLKDKSRMYIRREYQRICEQQKNNQSQQNIKNKIFFQTNFIQQKNKNIIKTYIENGKIFYQKLLKEEELNLDIIFQNGKYMLNSLQDIKNYKHNYNRISKSSKFLLNNFTTKIVQQNSLLIDIKIDEIFQNKLKKDQNISQKDLNFKQISENIPLLKVQNDCGFQMKIIQSNENWQKLFYFSKEETYQKSIFSFFSNEFAKNIKEQLINDSETEIELIQKQFLVFIKNKMGYSVVCQVKIFQQSKNIFYFLIQPKHLLLSYIILTEKESLLTDFLEKKQFVIAAISQMSISSGFKIENQGKNISTQFQQKIIEIIQQKKITTQKFIKFQPLTNIIQEQSSKNFNQIYIKYVETIQIKDQKYYIIQVRNTNQDIQDYSHSIDQFRNIAKQFDVILSQSQRQRIFTPPNFNFFYHTDGKVCAFQENQENIKRYFQQRNKIQETEEKNVITNNLDQDILQMCLIKNTLDYKENHLEEIVFKPILQINPQFQQDDKQISKIDRKIYEESQKIKNQIPPQWQKILRIIVVLMLIILFGIRITDFYYNQNRNTTNINQMNIFHSLTLVEQGYQSIALQILSLKYYTKNKTFNPTSINTALLNIKTNAQILFNLCPAIEAMLSQSEFQNSQNIFLISLNNFTNYALNSSISLFDQTLLISQLIYKMNDYFSKVENILVVASFQQTKQSYFNLLISLCLVFSVFIVGFFAYFCYLINYLQDQQIKIIKVFSKLKKSTFKKQLIKLSMFQEYLYMGNNVFEEENLKQVFKIYQNIQADESNYNKIGSKRIFKSKIKKYLMIGLVLVWSIASIGMCIEEYSYINQFQAVKSELQIRKSHLNQITTNYNFVWLTLNMFPNDQSKIQMFYQRMFFNDLAFRSKSFKYCQSYFSDFFRNYYYQIWSGNLCQFLNDSSHKDCLTYQNGIITNGLDQITAYLSRKYSFLMHNNYNQTIFRNLKLTSEISDMVVRYLSKLYSSNNVQFILEYYRICAVSLSSLRIKQAIQLVLVSFLGLFYYFLSSRQNRIKDLQKMFEFVPFEDLSKENYFIRYFQQKNLQIYRNNTQIN